MKYFLTSLIFTLFYSLNIFASIDHYTEEELAQMNLLLSQSNGLRVALRLHTLPVYSNELKRNLTNAEVLKDNELQSIALTLSNEDFIKFKDETALTYSWRLAGETELWQNGIDLRAENSELIRQLEGARSNGKIFQIRMWSMDGVQALNRALDNVENEITQFIEPQSKAFGILVGLFSAQFAVSLVSSELNNLNQNLGGIEQLGGGILKLAVAHPSTRPLIADFALNTSPAGIAPLFDILKGSQKLGFDVNKLNFPVLAMAGVSAFQAGAAGAEMASNLMLSIPYKEDRANITKAKRLLNGMIQTTAYGNVFLADDDAIQTFSNLIGKYISLTPQSQSNTIKIGRSMLDIYEERCSSFDAFSNAELSREYKNGTAHYYLEFIDSQFDICLPLWDTVTVNRIMLKSKTKSRALFEVNLFGVKVPSIGSAVSPFLSAGIGVLNSFGLPLRQINNRVNLAQNNNVWERITGNAGAKNIPLQRSSGGYIFTNLTEVIDDKKVRSLVEKEHSEFEIEIHMTRTRSKALQNSIQDEYTSLAKLQLDALKNGPHNKSLYEETFDLSFSKEALKKLGKKENKTLFMRMSRPVMMIFNSTLGVQ